MVWIALIYLVRLAVGDLQDVNRGASLGVHFPPSTKHILLMLFGVGFEGFRYQSSNRPLPAIRLTAGFLYYGEYS